MTPSARASIAFIAGVLISRSRSSAVYDFSRGKYVLFSGNVNKSSVSIYDHDVGCHISGGGSEKQFSLYHHGGSHHMQLNIKGNTFSGYDYGSRSSFSGQVSGNTINLYDFSEGRYFNYAT